MTLKDLNLTARAYTILKELSITTIEEFEVYDFEAKRNTFILRSGYGFRISDRNADELIEAQKELSPSIK